MGLETAHILLAEDDIGLRNLYQIGIGVILEELGKAAHFITCESFKQFAESAKCGPFALCIIDGLNGDWLEIVNTLLESEQPKDTIIVNSGDASYVAQARAMELEAFNKLRANEGMGALLTKIKAILSSQKS